MFVLSIVEAVRIYINAKSDGLAKYTPTFSTYLITTTLGTLFCYIKRQLQWSRSLIKL